MLLIKQSTRDKELVTTIDIEGVYAEDRVPAAQRPTDRYIERKLSIQSIIGVLLTEAER